MNLIRVLVTGAGSGVCQGIIKALNASSLPVYIIAADIDPLNSALFRAHDGILLPKVESEGALELVIKELKKANINIILIGSELDLIFYAEHKEIIERETGALVVVSPYETVMVADDKWLTAEFLRQNNLPYALSSTPHGVDEAIDVANSWGYPLILKNRTGTSNRQVYVIESKEQLLCMFDNVPKPMLQKLINRPSKYLCYEYTCSVFKCRDGRILGPFTARRTLRGGSSWIVEVDRFEELHPLLLSIGSILPIMGSLNVQLMLGLNGYVPFEFNARFSGTTAVRAHFGFNEPEMTVRNYFLNEEIDEAKIRRGLAFRYLEEVFVENSTANQAQK
jgi:carbamoyl-phosphate synthase large subunit